MKIGEHVNQGLKDTARYISFYYRFFKFSKTARISYAPCMYLISGVYGKSATNDGKRHFGSIRIGEHNPIF